MFESQKKTIDLTPERLFEGTVLTKDIWEINKKNGIKIVYREGEIGYADNKTKIIEG